MPFRSPNLNPDDFKSLVISWSQFCREPLPERNFTFWEWFYRVMNLTATHMRGKPARESLPERNFTFWEWFYRVMNLTATHMRGKPARESLPDRNFTFRNGATGSRT